MKLRERSTRGYRAVVVSTLLIQALGIVPYALFAVLQSRWLGAAGRGDVTLIVNLVFFAVVAADLGYTAALPFQSGRRNEEAGLLVGNFLAWSTGSLLTVFLVLLMLASLGGVAGFGPLVRSYAAVIGLMMVVTEVTNFLQFEALGANDFWTYNLLLALSQTAMVIVFSGTYVLHRSWLSVQLAIICFIAGNLVEIPLALILSHGRILQAVRTARVSLKSLQRHLGVGVKAFCSGIFGQLYTRADLLLIFLLLHDTGAVGVYSIAILLLTAAAQIPNWLALTIIPKAAHDDPGVPALTIKLAWAAMALAATGGLLYVALAPVLPFVLTRVFGAGFSTVYWVLLLMLPRAILQSAGSLLAGNLAGKGFGLYHPLAAAAGTAASVGLNLLLIPLFRISGAAVVMSLSYAVQLLILLYGFSRTNAMTLPDIAGESVAFWQGAARAVRARVGRAAASAS